jgi:steroid 5-alpha reductase family enzyme
MGQMPAAFFAVLLAMVLVMGTGWVFRRAMRDGGWSDVFWTYGTGIACAGVALMPPQHSRGPSWRQEVVAALAVLWALRLGTYVARRVRRGPEDSRYAALRQAWGRHFQGRMLGLLIVQAPATALLSLSVSLAAHAPGRPRIADAAGIALVLSCIAGEALADRQMRRFKAQHADRRMVCESGLWHWSRHPNYFFEILIWVAYPIIAIRTADPMSWLALVAPLVMFCLVRFLTGVPPLEAALLRSKGDAYRRYQARVSALLPLPRRDAR